MRSISALSASEVSGPLATTVQFVPSSFWSSVVSFLAEDANPRLGGNSLGNPRSLKTPRDPRPARAPPAQPSHRPCASAPTPRAASPASAATAPCSAIRSSEVGADQLAELDSLVSRSPAVACRLPPPSSRRALRSQPSRAAVSAASGPAVRPDQRIFFIAYLPEKFRLLGAPGASLLGTWDITKLMPR